MSNNRCASCDAIIPEGVQVCGNCLRENEIPGYYQAASVLMRFCRMQRQTKGGVCPDSCPFRHHCENKIANWDKLSLPSAVENTKEGETSMLRNLVEKVQEKKKASKSWIYNHTYAVYGILVTVICILMFLLGVFVGNGLDALSKSQTVNVTETVSLTDVSAEPEWYLVTGEEI